MFLPVSAADGDEVSAPILAGLRLLVVTWHTCSAGRFRDTLFSSMKVFLKIVAVAVIGVLSAYPTMARVTCAEGMAAKAPCAPHCHRAMGAKAMGCSMPLQAGRTGCDENCCQNGMQPGFFQTGAKPKTVKAGLVAILPTVAVSEGKLFANLPSDGRVGTGPPRYVLFRVLRI